MSLDLARLPTGTAGWSALVDHALTLGDLAEVGYLELKSALPFGERSARKRSAVVISRTVLGMANRMPDAAMAHLAGHGVLLIGIQDQQVEGAERVDGSVLTAALQPYLGEDGPGWDYVFVDHTDGLVLAVVVDPPRWGDRIHTCRRDYTDDTSKLAVRDGEILVRQLGATRPASSIDVANLEKRRDQAPDQGANVKLGYDSGFDHLDPENVPDLFAERVDRKAERMLSQLPQRTSPYTSTRLNPDLLSVSFQERRTPTAFKTEVEKWRADAHAEIPNAAADFIRHELARGRLLLTNASSKYLEAVRAQADFPAELVVLADSDSGYHGHDGEEFQVFRVLPELPTHWGSDTVAGLARGRLPRPALPRTPGLRSEVDVEALPGGGCRVTWDVGDLRPGSTETSREKLAVYTVNHRTEVTVPWTVTARGIDHVFTGEMRLGCAQEPGVVLQWVSNSAGNE